MERRNDALTLSMSERQSLFAPKDVVDDYRTDARAMVSLNVLTDNGNSYQFFHESFFDYAFSRRFCRTGRSLHSFLTEGDEDQQLFRRAQVRQILGYRRENRFDEYLLDLRELLSSENIRFHIRRMVASELRRVMEPTANECRLLNHFCSTLIYQEQLLMPFVDIKAGLIDSIKSACGNDGFRLIVNYSSTPRSGFLRITSCTGRDQIRLPNFWNRMSIEVVNGIYV